ncbi:MAG: hypothetical protein JSU05_12890, partial [Bacteroidetes bacterium]|nr:hypothetical protein [Bacteroidota bacterium]
MPESYWEYLNYALKQEYYTDILWFVASATALVLSIKFFRRESSYYFLIAYIVAGTLISTPIIISIKYFFNLKGLSYVRLLETSNTLFEVIEINFFLFLFFKLLPDLFITNIIKSAWALFITISIIFIVEIRKKG